MARGRAQVDALGDAADGGKLLRHLLRHELAAESGLRPLADIDLEPVRPVHVVDVPAEPAAQTLEDKLLRRAPLGVAHAAFAGILGDPRHARRHAHRLLGRARQGAVAHRRDHHRHGELERPRPVQTPDLRPHLHRHHRVACRARAREVALEREVGEVRQRARAAIAPHPVAADLGLDVDVLLHLRVPVVRRAREGEEGNAAHLLLAGRVAQTLAGVHDLLEAALVGDLVTVQERADVVDLGLLDIGQLRVGAERAHRAADIDIAGRHVLAHTLAGFAQDDDAPAVHHVTGHEVGVADAAERPRLHHLARTRAHVAVHHDLHATDRNARDRARVAAHRHRSGVHVVAETPAGIVVDLEACLVRKSCAEVARRAPDMHPHRVDQADADMMARVGVEDLDVLSLRSPVADLLVGVADGNLS